MIGAALRHLFPPRLIAGAALLLCSMATAAHPPRGIAVAADGRVYFSDLERIWTIAPNGRMQVLRRSGGHTHELFLDEGDHLFGEDSLYDPGTRSFRAALWMITPDGRFSYTYGPAARPAPGLGVFRDRLGCTLHADDNRAGALLLFRLCPGGRPEALPGSLSAAEAPPRELLENMGGAAFGPDGSFFFRNGTIVQRLRAGDRLVTAASSFSKENFGIAVDQAGALYVVEYERRRIVRVGPDGRRSVPVTAEAPWAPTGVAVRGGALYVLEATHHSSAQPTRFRVRRVAVGRVTLLGQTGAAVR